MNGYGQPITPEQYAQALQTQSVLKGRENALSNAQNSGNPFMALGAALGNALSGKIGQYKDANMADVDMQIKQFQAQKAAEAEAHKQAQAQAKAQAEYERRRRDQIEDEERAQKRGREDHIWKQQNTPKEAPKMSFDEQMFARMSPEQQQSFLNQRAGIARQSTFSPEIQAAVQTGSITAQQAKQAQMQKAMGASEQKLGAEARIKMGLLNDAEKSLAQYKQEAFKDGDYQEIGSMFGNTDNYLKNAVDNLLRFESGASISDDERDTALGKYSPSMFSSDETNMTKIRMFEDKIKELRGSLGGAPKQQQNAFGQQNNTFLKYTGGQ